MDHYRLTSLLEKHYGYHNFRPKQLDIIRNIIEARDCIALLPTGGGKSLCYQLPSIYLKSKCLVISPLIALMEDQIEALKKRAIPGYSIHSGMDQNEMSENLNSFFNNSFGILYVSPERLGNKQFKALISKIQLSHIAIDEAHCISQWGHDFRPAYLSISKFIESLSFKPQISALTATATSRTIADIKQYAGLQNPQIIRKGFYRENINIEIHYSESPLNKLLELKQKFASGSEIIYSRSRRGVKILTEKLEASGLNSSYYHGNLPFPKRKSISEQWQRGNIPTIVATNAFGMGIDKSNVRRVIHLDIPPSIEEYYQEIGRSGRDGLTSQAFIIIAKGEEKRAKEKLMNGYVTHVELKRFIKGITDLSTERESVTIFPFIIRRIAKNLKLHPFQVVKCLELCDKAGILYVSRGVLEPSRVMVISSIAKDQVFHQKKGLKFFIIDHLLKNYEYLFDAHIVIIEEQIANDLNIQTNQVEESLIQLEREGLISYQKRKDPPLIKFLNYTFSNIQLDRIFKIQENSIMKLDKMIEYIQSKECRMQVLMRYFDEHCDPCRKCDNCKECSISEDGYLLFINKLRNLHHEGTLYINQALLGLDNETKSKIISKLKVLENEKLIVIENGKITRVISERI